jgi:hypothetical protein
MTQDDLAKIKVDLIKAELSLIDSKIKSIVDRLWQIRALCQTLWVGLVAVGLGAGTGDKQPIPELLWISTGVPLWFGWIDASYQRWYRRFRMREDAIRRLFADSRQRNETADQGANPPWIGALSREFPLLDMDGRVTCGDDPNYQWWGSRWSGLFDTTPILTFGSLAALSLVLGMLKSGRNLRWIVPLFVITGILILYGMAFLVRRRLFGRAAQHCLQPSAAGAIMSRRG